MILKDIRDKYNIDNLIAPEQYFYCKIKKEKYGLNQANRLTNDKLRDHLAPFIYFTDPLAPNIWKHITHVTGFCFCLDSFGLKYVNQNDINYLTNALRTELKVYINYEGTDYCGLKLT